MVGEALGIAHTAPFMEAGVIHITLGDLTPTMTALVMVAVTAGEVVMEAITLITQLRAQDPLEQGLQT